MGKWHASKLEWLFVNLSSKYSFSTCISNSSSSTAHYTQSSWKKDGDYFHWLSKRYVCKCSHKSLIFIFSRLGHTPSFSLIEWPKKTCKIMIRMKKKTANEIKCGFGRWKNVAIHFPGDKILLLPKWIRKIRELSALRARNGCKKEIFSKRVLYFVFVCVHVCGKAIIKVMRI